MLDKSYSTNPNGVSTPNYKVIIADLDGDGKDDITQLQLLSKQGEADKTILRTLYSKGCFNDKFQYEIRNDTLSKRYLLPRYYEVSDFNNDGIMDFVIQDSLVFDPLIVYLNKNKSYEFVKEIKDGIGKEILLNYQIKYFIAETQSYSTNKKKKYLLPVINILKGSNGLGSNLDSLQYEYKDAIFSMRRRAFLGFNQFTCINSIENKKITSIFAVENSKQIMKPVSQTTYHNNVSSEEITYNYVFKDFFVSNDIPIRYISYSNETTVKNIFSDIKTKTTTDLNNDGRVETTNTVTFDGLNANIRVLTETNTYSYNTITLNGNQKKTVPTQIISKQRYDYSNIVLTNTTTYNYYTDDTNKGRLKWEENSNSDGSIKTSYNNYLVPGICKEKTVSAADLLRKTTCDYDETRRFTTSIKNVLEHETKIFYDAKTGNKTKEIDPNGLITEYKYDAFGNLIKVIYPDLTETNTTVEWYSSSDIPNAKYKITTKTDAKPDVTVYYDVLGREVCRYDDGQYHETQYNNKGQVARTSYPFGALNNNRTWHEYTYDTHGRKLTETAPYTDLSYNYSNNNRTETITDHLRNTSSSKTYDALGRIITASDKGGTINYSYMVTVDEKHKTTISAVGAITTILSDQWGNRLYIKDPDAGEIVSTYTKLNELETQKDANGNLTTYQYDALGRVTQKKIKDSGNRVEFIDYVYDYLDRSNQLKGKLYQINLNGRQEEIFKYDLLGRMVYHDKRVDGSNVFKYTYNANGQMETLTYPDGFSIKYSYLSDGKLKEIRRNNPNSALIYKVNTRNLYNQTTACEYGNEVKTYRTYNSLGLLTRIQTGKKVKVELPDDPPSGDEKVTIIEQETEKYYVDSSILNYRYAYDTEKGLMVSRSESVMNRLETYQYDQLDRLLSVTAGKIGETGTVQTLKYYGNGNIQENSKVGIYHYETTSPPKPHAVSIVVPINENVISANQCDVNYNHFNQPTKITEGNYQVTLTYGSNQQRKQMIQKKGDKYIAKQYYINKYHERSYDYTDTAKIVCLYNYIYGDNGVVALHIRSSFYEPDTLINDTSYYYGGGEGQTKNAEDTDSLYFIHTDHLGSYCAITSPSKKLAQRNYFDPWGNMPKLFIGHYQRGDTIFVNEPYSNGDSLVSSEAPTLNFSLTHRGFTGHEHYPYFKIINMNGRLYDPVIGRFFSPDKYVANSSFTQDFNRYTYARNNPLMYVDPSGESFFEVLGNILFAPVRFFTEKIEMFNDKINGYSRPGGYFNPSYLAGKTEPGSYTSYNPANALSYNHPNYIQPTAGLSTIVPGTGWSLRADNSWDNILNRPIIMDPNSRLGKRFQAMFYTEFGLDPGKPIPAEYRNSAVVYAIKHNWFKYAPNPSGGILVGLYPDKLKGNAGATDPELTKDNKFFTGGSTMYLHEELAFSNLWKLFKTLGHELVHVSQFLALKGEPASLYRDDEFRDMLDSYAHIFSNFLGGNYWQKEYRYDWSNVPQFSDYYKRVDYKSFPWVYLYNNPF